MAGNIKTRTGGGTGSAAGSVPSSRTIFTTSPLTIDGGSSADLSGNRTIAVNTATLLAGIPTLAGTNIFTGTNYFTGPVSFTTGSPVTLNAALSVTSLQVSGTAIFYSDVQFKLGTHGAALTMRSAEKLITLSGGAGSLVTVTDRKSTRLNSSHSRASRMPSSA